MFVLCYVYDVIVVVFVGCVCVGVCLVCCGGVVVFCLFLGW